MGTANAGWLRPEKAGRRLDGPAPTTSTTTTTNQPSLWAGNVLCGATAGLTVVIELAGWRGSYAIWGDPQNLTKVWWHFPLIAAGVFLGILFWPFHEDIDDEPRGW
jgi:hypothetical protein